MFGALVVAGGAFVVSGESVVCGGTVVCEGVVVFAVVRRGSNGFTSIYRQIESKIMMSVSSKMTIQIRFCNEKSPLF